MIGSFMPDWTFNQVATALSAAAALLYFLDVCGVVGWARRRITRRPWRAPRHARFWSFIRIAGFVGLGVTVALGFVSNSVLKIALSALLVVVFFVREYQGWQREAIGSAEAASPSPSSGVAAVADASDESPPETPPAAAPAVAPPAHSPTMTGGTAPPPRATYTVSRGVVELRLANVPAGPIGRARVVCKVTGPDGRESVATNPLLVAPAGPLGAAIFNMFGTKTAVVQFPTDFDDLPPLVPGLYRVTWEETDSLPIRLDPRRTFASFRYG